VIAGHRFDPLPVADGVTVFAGAPFRWWICGGNALDLHLGTSWRPHDDLDVGIVRTAAPALHRWMDGWDLHVAAGGRLTPWTGRPLAAGENNVWARRSPSEPWTIDITVGSGTSDRWIYRRDERISRPWTDAVLHSGDIPYLAPEIQLLFKAKSHRPKDDVDAGRVIPALDAGRRRFLADHLPVDHPWRRLLGDPGAGTVGG
jgi:hypothetical protein